MRTFSYGTQQIINKERNRIWIKGEKWAIRQNGGGQTEGEGRKGEKEGERPAGREEEGSNEETRTWGKTSHADFASTAFPYFKKSNLAKDILWG